jgi:hypothetical protein
MKINKALVYPISVSCTWILLQNSLLPVSKVSKLKYYILSATEMNRIPGVPEAG